MVANQSTIPSDAFIGGYDIHNEALHVCRRIIDSTQHSGKANKLLGCVVPYRQKEYFFKDQHMFEVLVAKSVDWVARHGTDPLPEHTLVVGSKLEGNSYVGRCNVGGALVIGKIDYLLSNSLSGREWKDCNNHEVLVCV